MNLIWSSISLSLLLIQEVCVGLLNIIPDWVTLWNLRNGSFQIFWPLLWFFNITSINRGLHVLDYGVLTLSRADRNSMKLQYMMIVLKSMTNFKIYLLVSIFWKISSISSKSQLMKWSYMGPCQLKAQKISWFWHWKFTI
jgi:hypothetical protein